MIFRGLGAAVPARSTSVRGQPMALETHTVTLATTAVIVDTFLTGPHDLAAQRLALAEANTGSVNLGPTRSTSA